MNIMSKRILTFTLMAFFALGLTSSCKYEEGPFISLRSKKERVANTWKIEKQIDEDGNTTQPNNNTKWTFTKDGKVKINGTEYGKWEFGDNKETFILIIGIASNNSETEFTILKLKEKEFWLEEDDGSETHFEPA